MGRNRAGSSIDELSSESVIWAREHKEVRSTEQGFDPDENMGDSPQLNAATFNAPPRLNPRFEKLYRGE
jgi:hypothetical protein